MELLEIADFRGNTGYEVTAGCDGGKSKGSRGKSRESKGAATVLSQVNSGFKNSLNSLF